VNFSQGNKDMSEIDLKNSIDEIRKEFGSLKEVFKGLNQPAPRFTGRR
jgi:hypothetical protein